MKTPHPAEVNSGDQVSMKLNASQWRLPSGQPLGEYALEAGFVVPSLWATMRRPKATGTQDPRTHAFAPYRRRMVKELNATATAREC
jgi:hypothetical protein